MNRILFLTLLMLGLILPMDVSADTYNPTFSFTMYQYIDDGDDEEEDEGTNKRIPIAPVYCTIDFENKTIIGNFASHLVSIEVWDEEEDQCIAKFDDDTSFIEFLDTIEGAYKLCFYTEEYIYIGYICL